MPLISSLAVMGPLLFSAAFTALLAISYRAYRRYTRISLTDVPGPEPESFIMGKCVFPFACSLYR